MVVVVVVVYIVVYKSDCIVVESNFKVSLRGFRKVENKPENVVKNSMCVPVKW